MMMPPPARPRPLAALALLLALAFRPEAASAQAACPPGMMGAGGGSAGWVGCAPVYNPLEGVSVDTDPTPRWARGPSIDPMAGRLAAATTIFEMEATRYEELGRRLKTDPEFARLYRKYHQGAWEQFERPDKRQCAAVYSREGGLIMMHEAGGGQPGALLVFLARTAPAPAKPEQVTVELRQNKDTQAQRVKAFSYRPTETDYGALALAVPSLDALLTNMLDTHSFEIKIGGKVVFSLEWRGGVAARDALAACMARRR